MFKDIDARRTAEMPRTPDQAQRHTKKAASPAAQKPTVADESGDNAKAMRTANTAVAKRGKSAKPSPLRGALRGRY